MLYNYNKIIFIHFINLDLFLIFSKVIKNS
jgi:hypothetical protein